MDTSNCSYKHCSSCGRQEKCTQKIARTAKISPLCICPVIYENAYFLKQRRAYYYLFWQKLDMMHYFNAE